MKSVPNAEKDKDLEFIKTNATNFLMAHRPKDKLIKFKLEKHRIHHILEESNKKIIEDIVSLADDGEDIDEFQIIEDLKGWINTLAEMLTEQWALNTVLNDELAKMARNFLSKCREVDALTGEKPKSKKPDLKVVKP